MKLKQIQDVEDLVDELFPIPLLTIIVFFVLLIRLERTDDEIPERKNQIKRMRGENMNNMVEICLKTIGPSPPSRILIPSPISVSFWIPNSKLNNSPHICFVYCLYFFTIQSASTKNTDTPEIKGKNWCWIDNISFWYWTIQFNVCFV